MPEVGSRLLTFGHGTASESDITELLQQAGVDLLLDIRTAPGSRLHPHVNRSELERWLPDAGITYQWEPRLGGFRKPAVDSPDVVWRNSSFRGYAGYMRQQPFRDGFAELRALSAQHSVAVMCSDTVWWRCHRRLVADYWTLTVPGPVAHLMHDHRLVPHIPTEGVRRNDDGLLVYDGLPSDGPAADRAAE